MPMFGSVISADGFNGRQFSGFDQVVPDVSAQISELAATMAPPRRAVLVYDEHATDLYTLNVRTDFTRYFTQALAGQQPQPFTPGVPDTHVEFQAIAEAVCYTAAAPPAVLYAGRASVLASLVSYFKTASNCAGRKITLITAGDGDGLAPAATAPVAGAGQVSVIYTDIINLSKLTPAFRLSYRQTLSSLDPSDVGLADTWTIATYNAMQAAWTAINGAYSATHRQVPTKEDVAGFAERLNQLYAPVGALGRFSLSVDGRLLSPDIPIFEDAGGQRSTLRS